jgi:uncharacterized membrane protein SirB2
VLLTGGLFVLRAAWSVLAPRRLAHRWVRTVPHVTDTLLLLSGVWLAWQIGAAGVRGWLPAKIVGLAIYIGLGTIAIKRGRRPRARAAAALAALLTLGYIVSVALAKSPWGFLSRWL